jgi:two-component system chemotaxis response regulator CheB
VIRVLIVDDSVTTRELVRAVLESDPDLVVVGEAADGTEAVDMVAQLRPDVITMDVNMPVMNGYQATQVIMDTMPTPIIVLTSVTHQEMIHRGLDILLAGALDIVEKPSSLTARDYQMVGGELIAKIKAVAELHPFQL